MVTSGVNLFWGNSEVIGKIYKCSRETLWILYEREAKLIFRLLTIFLERSEKAFKVSREYYDEEMHVAHLPVTYSKKNKQYFRFQPSANLLRLRISISLAKQRHRNLKIFWKLVLSNKKIRCCRQENGFNIQLHRTMKQRKSKLHKLDVG